MTTKMTVSQILAAAAQLPLEEQRQLNSELVAQIKRVRAVESVKIGATLVVGQVVTFSGGPRVGFKRMRIDKFTRDGSKVIGPECQADGTPIGHQLWKVSNTLVRAA